jgi:hypothetical protein
MPGKHLFRLPVKYLKLLKTCSRFRKGPCCWNKQKVENTGMPGYKTPGEEQDLKLCDDSTSVQILCFWTLSVVLFLSKTPPCLYFKTQRFGCLFCLLLQVKPTQ